MLATATFTPPANAESLADADITAAVEMLFLTRKGVTSHLIDVVTKDGIVELSGSTDSLLSRQRAEDIALAVRGVRGVINELTVNTPDLPDTAVHSAVASALADDPATSDYNVRCYVQAGTVRLVGTVQSWAEKQLVLRVVEGVRGVHEINADRLVSRGAEVLNSDEDITIQIRELLDWDIRVNSALVQVRTAQQVVHLSGTVGSAAEKARIIATAYQAGAEHVDARDLFVAAWALGPELRRDKFAPKADTDIAQAVRDALRLDPRVQAFAPLVQVHDGTVTLAGSVSNLRARQVAEQDARLVVGVCDVHNLLKVRAERTSPDADIQATIVDALARDPYLGHYSFVVNVQHGKATLYGQVGSHFEQAQAGDIAAGVNEVVEVENRLSLPGQPNPTEMLPLENAAPGAPSGVLSDHTLAENIRRRCYWSATLHAQEIEIQAEKGRVTLLGTVHTWLDRRQAAQEAYEAGARDVNNHLRVTSAAYVG
ncbi:BON domain-containing protein [Hymenobacter swuensis]|uniref:BON domain-containing protein n=1 Tax=Hymenobacter swuensis DY53 TaxID=1227739 RepID=W8F736_9BACT|nr:BON domain-containing protein [Hymenobacter swuensis]AHJ97530.1 hypothetical protein Hsw_1935 [Hymenobacter swuensis DY53]